MTRVSESFRDQIGELYEDFMKYAENLQQVYLNENDLSSSETLSLFIYLTGYR